MSKFHEYKTTVVWTGNKGAGTVSAKEYERSHTVSIEGKPLILASSDTPFRGDGTKHNPEDFLVSALASCHMLWYLHLCADAGVIIVSYEDNAHGKMEEKESGGGNFVEVILHPQIKVKSKAMIEKAMELHHIANQKCFIANSCNFPVRHEATYTYENE